MKTIVTKILFYISGLVPKNEMLWLFGAWEGKTYSDNSKYMFEYILNNHPEIKAVWLTKSKKVLSDMRGKGYLCYHKWSIKGIMLAFRARVAFETEGDGDVSSFLNKTLIIQLWHGLGIKAFQWKDKTGKLMFSPELVKKHKMSYWMTTSSLYNKVLKELLDIPDTHMFITGYPRNDTFVNRPQNEFFEGIKGTETGKKIVAYLPTHRNFGSGINTKNYNSVEELSRLDELLGERNIILFYKPHFHEIKNLVSLKHEFKNIIIATNEEMFGDLYSYAHYFDALISDYSTISYEFACTKKPVVLFPYDLDDYNTQDGGLLNYYWEYQIGPMCYTWKDTIDTVVQLFQDDKWYRKREESRIAWHQYNDGQNCQRVYDQVMRLVDLKN